MGEVIEVNFITRKRDHDPAIYGIATMARLVVETCEADSRLLNQGYLRGSEQYLDGLVDAVAESPHFWALSYDDQATALRMARELMDDAPDPVEPEIA